MKTQALYMTWNPFYLPSLLLYIVITPTLSKTSHHLCKTSQVSYVCHHVHSTWHHIQPLRQQPLVFMTSHALYWWHHMHYIWHVIYCVWYHIHIMCDITQCLYLWHHTLCLWHIHFIWHHTECYDNTTIVYLHSNYVWHHTHCVCVITPQWINFIIPFMCDITDNMCMTSYALHVTSHSQFRKSHLFMYEIRSTLYDLTSSVSLSSHYAIDDITDTICMTSHTVHLWHHIPYIYDIISTKYDITTLFVDDATLSICMTSFALQMTTHPLYHTKPQCLWCDIHFRQDNAAPVSDIEPTVSMSSQRLHWHLTHFCMTSHPPSVWNHMNYI